MKRYCILEERRQKAALRKLLEIVILYLHLLVL
jgi:hypothetical protein